MWKQLKDTIYFLALDLSNGYCVSVTDFTSIWSKHLNEECFLEEAKKSNKLLQDIEPKNLKQHIVDMLKNPNEIRSAIVQENDLLLSVSSREFGFPLHFKLSLPKGSNEQFFSKVTHQLLLTIADLRSSETELRSHLLKKDEEINAYKAKYSVEKVAKYLRTTEYNDTRHMELHTAYQNKFNNENIPKHLLEIQAPMSHTNIAQNITKVRNNQASANSTAKDPTKIKTENMHTDLHTLQVKQELETQNLDVLENNTSIKTEEKVCNSKPHIEKKQSNEISNNVEDTTILDNQESMGERMVVKQESDPSSDMQDSGTGGIKSNIKRETNESQTVRLTPKKKRKGLNF